MSHIPVVSRSPYPDRLYIDGEAVGHDRLYLTMSDDEYCLSVPLGLGGQTHTRRILRLNPSEQYDKQAIAAVLSLPNAVPGLLISGHNAAMVMGLLRKSVRGYELDDVLGQIRVYLDAAIHLT